MEQRQRLRSNGTPGVVLVEEEEGQRNAAQQARLNAIYQFQRGEYIRAFVPLVEMLI